MLAISDIGNKLTFDLLILRVVSESRAAVLSHAEYVPTLTAAAALRVKAALSKAAW